MDSIEDILKAKGATCIQEIKDRMQREGVNATGRTASSLNIKTEPFNLQILGASYFKVLEEGRGAGKVPYKFNENELRAWAKAKNLTASFESESHFNMFLYFLARKIQREGTKTYRQGGKDIYTTPVKEMVEDLKKDISKFFVLEIKDNLKKK